MKYVAATALCMAAACLPSALSAQDVEAEVRAPAGPPSTVFDGDYLSVGVGVAYNASYSGSDDYQLNILPIVQGSLGGVDINPRPAGLALDFIPDPDSGVAFAAGPLIRINRDRADAEDINDEIVAAYGELETAIEVGASLGVKFPQLLNPFDSLNVNVDAAWDVNGAHGGQVVTPSVTYFTPLSRAMAASLSLSATFVDDDFADYYYSVPTLNTLLPDPDVLPGFEAEGGLESLGVNLLLAYDLSGDVTDGGLSLIGLGGYSRLQGDAAETPFTSIRGSADQYFVAVGIGYTF